MSDTDPNGLPTEVAIEILPAAAIDEMVGKIRVTAPLTVTVLQIGKNSSQPAGRGAVAGVAVAGTAATCAG